MLTLTNALTIAGATVYQDDANQLATFEQSIADRPVYSINDDGTVSQTKPPAGPAGSDTETTPLPKYYLLPETPVISKGPDGSPLFSLIVYRRDEATLTTPATTSGTTATGQPDVGGGILTFTTELISDQFDAVKAALNKQAGGTGGTDQIELDYVQFISGDISVSVAGETGDGTTGGGEFVSSIIGNGKLGGVGANRRAVMVKLTQEGAALLSQLDKLKTLPINIQYDLVFEHRLLGVKMIAYCDIASSYTLIQTLGQQDSSYNDGYLGLSSEHQDPTFISKVTEALVNSKTMYVTVIPESSQVDQDTLTALEKEGSDILNKEVAGFLASGPPPSNMDRNELQSYVQTHTDQLNYTIDRRMVLQQTFTPSANLQNLLVGANLDSLVAFVDLRTAFFTVLPIPIRVNADFESNAIDSVTVTITYNSQGPDGKTPQQARQSFNFTGGDQIEKFEAYANTLAEVSYDWDATVYYKGSTVTYTFSVQGAQDNFLVVDVADLGLLTTEFALGLYDETHYPQAVVSAKYDSKALGTEVATQIKLDHTNTATPVPWSAVIREKPVNGFQYKVDWLHYSEGSDQAQPPELQEGNWITSSDSHVEVNSPLPQEMSVAVTCSGSFASGDPKLSQVVAAFHYQDDANHHIVDNQLTFTSDHQTQTWTVDLMDPTKRDYTYQWANIYDGGVVEHIPADGSWAPGQPGFVVVGEQYSMTVNVLPLLLTLGTPLMAAEVDLDYEDASSNISLTDTVVFSQNDQVAKTWYVKGKQGGPTSYGYVVKYYWADGSQTQSARVTSESNVLLVPIPTPPAPAPAPAPVPSPAPAAGAPTTGG